jgi:Flagellar hook-length control protein FliK
MRLEVSSLQSSSNTGVTSSLFTQWRVGAIVDAVAIRDPADGQLWLNIGNARVPARIASGDAVGPTDGERMQLRVLRDKPVLALETLTQDADTTVNDGLRRYLPKQTSPAPLLANIALLARSTSLMESLPRPIQSAVAALWQSLPQATELATPDGLEQALQRSGVFLEASLANSNDSGARNVIAHDLKATLIDLKNALQRNGAIPQTLTTQELAGTPDPLPSMRGNMPPLHAAQATLAQLDSLPERMNELAAQTDGSLARLRSVQLVNAENASQAPVWLMELPFRRDQQPETLRFRFERNNGDSNSHSQPQQESSWTVEAALSLHDSGGLHARVSLQGSRISVHLRAESASLVVDLNTRLPELAAVLRDAGLEVDRLICLHGMPAEDPRWRNAVPLLDVRA